ncbi:MAG: NADP oxidoreductase, partial [Deltaproteobacteria bacterium]|nr:NADP oxidoreductase [Candidatus Tharpellaceae bacterium]
MVMEKILLKNIDKLNSQDIETFISSGGYKALEKALSMKPENIIVEVKKSKLIGRGGAGFPTGLKWEFTRKEKGEPKYVVCNADEGEPGTFKDKVILSKDPHLLLESITICGYAVGAEKGFIYIRGEYFEEIDILNKSIKEAKAKGFLGENICGSNFSFDIQIFKGAGAYICGEETSLFESIGGGRATSREKPPFPTQFGVYGKPTVINNVETLCNVPSIILNGSDWYSQIGSPDSPG